MKRTMIWALIAVLLTIAACGKKDGKTPNMQQIQSEQGIPVRVKTVKPEAFSRELSYNAALSGSEESYGQALVSEVVSTVNARVGDRVQAGQLIVSFPQSTPAAQYEQAKTGFNAARQAYQRMQNLFAEGAISRQDLDNLETQFKIAEANLAASEKMINVRAPISGVITGINVNPGDRTYPGQNLFTVAGGSGYKAKLMIPDQDLSSIRLGIPAAASWGEIELSGRVSRIAMALDPYAKAVPVEVSFTGLNARVPFGVTAQIRLSVGTVNDAIVVSREQLITENGQKYVWVKEGDRARKRAVETGLDNQLQYEVISGLNAGDLLITEGQSLLADNARIRVTE